MSWKTRSFRLLAAMTLAAAPTLAATAQEPAVEAASGATEAKAKAEAKLSEEQVRLNLESFDAVWETIRDKHFDPDLNGVDWPAVREELRPKVAEAGSMDEARGAMQEMIKRLNQSHFGIIPSSVYDAIDGDEDTDRGDGQAGLHVRAVDGEALVVLVEPGSPAEEIGIKPGWVVEAVEGKPVGPVLEKVVEAFEDSTQYDLYASRAVERRLGGPVGSERTATFRDGDGNSVEKTITLAKPRGTTARFGNLPPMQVYFESRVIDDEIPYVHWSAFFDPAGLIPKIGEAITGHLDAPGLVLDLRGNPGGIGAMAMGICGWLFGEAGQRLGTMSTRDTDLNFVVFPRPRTFDGPVAVLVDGCSASTSEIFAGGLQDLGRARIFGTRTAGAALPSVVVKLPNGDGFQYAFANYISADGEALEGSGVEPDQPAPPARDALLQGGDPALDAAVEWIRSQAAGRSGG
ncbi:S41 family peptidase [Tautonia plasticadhaerens]|uniref:Putative CtpA-like serine protease n=1 Tax=Tautonia plasticadhaerens TaxID=2527974 RepID=A0A518H2G4_9BACT|nr:S41 family peptidase [Tautonia plasticadhaerens]QDV35013.1 putative CtpA-like serine protease [Tautonia plasticadhaerens]